MKEEIKYLWIWDSKHGHTRLEKIKSNKKTEVKKKCFYKPFDYLEYYQKVKKFIKKKMN